MDRLVDRYRQEYESKIEAGPTSFTNRAFLGVVYAFQGRREDAREELVEAEKYAARDAFSGPQVRQYLALAHTLLGEYEDAATQLGLALAVPYQSAPTRAELLLEPVWEPLRELPEFVSLQRKLSQLESIG
jgi:Flp pilus assembly protein TadD